jgi:HK97 family phage major capsid protein
MASLVEVREELAAKNKELRDIFVEAGPDLDMAKVTSIHGDTHTKVAEIQRLKKVVDELGQEHDRLALIEVIGQQNEREYKRLTEPTDGLPVGGSNGAGSGNGYSGTGYGGTKAFQPQRIREMLNESKAYKAFVVGSGNRSITFDLPGVMSAKALITLTTVSPQNVRQPNLVEMAMETRTVADLMLEGEVDRKTVEYYEETTWTNAAGTVTEGAAKPESDWAVTLRTEAVQKIGHWLQATDESIQDVPWLESQLRGRLSFGVVRKEEEQILNGNGTAPNLRGILNRVGIQTQAKGTDPTPDAVYRGMQKIRGASGAGFAEPTAVVMHPNDWTDIKLLRTADGIYIWGNPSGEGPDRIWGLPVRQTTGISEGTGLVGAFRPHAEVLRRTGITVTMSSEHATNFTENKVTILAEERIALAVYRPTAFCTITGI